MTSKQKALLSHIFQAKTAKMTVFKCKSKTVLKEWLNEAFYGSWNTQ